MRNFIVIILVGIFCLGKSRYISSSNETFTALVHQAAGYYVDSVMSKSMGLKKTILVTAANFAYVNHLQNFKCFVDSKIILLLMRSLLMYKQFTYSRIILIRTWIKVFSAFT